MGGEHPVRVKQKREGQWGAGTSGPQNAQKGTMTPQRFLITTVKETGLCIGKQFQK